MRPFVIITIQDEKKNFIYDMEVPTDIPVKQLTENMIDTISSYNSKISLSPKPGILYCQRLKRELDEEETFGSAGIWTGDILVLRS